MPESDDDVIVSFGNVAPWMMPKRLEKRVEQQIAAAVSHVPASSSQSSQSSPPAADGHLDTPAGWD